MSLLWPLKVYISIHHVDGAVNIKVMTLFSRVKGNTLFVLRTFSIYTEMTEFVGLQFEEKGDDGFEEGSIALVRRNYLTPIN